MTEKCFNRQVVHLFLFYRLKLWLFAHLNRYECTIPISEHFAWALYFKKLFLEFGSLVVKQAMRILLPRKYLEVKS
jgi:hypothetical protein